MTLLFFHFPFLVFLAVTRLFVFPSEPYSCRNVGFTGIVLNSEELTSRTVPRLCSALPLRLLAVLLRATPGCCRRRNILYHFFFRVVLAGCMKAVYFWMLTSQLPRTGFYCCRSCFPTEPAGFSRQSFPGSVPAGIPARFLSPGPGQSGGGRHRCGLEGPLCSGPRVGVSVLLVRGIPRHMEQTGTCCWLHAGPVGLQQHIQARQLGWGRAGGRLMA